MKRRYSVHGPRRASNYGVYYAPKPRRQSRRYTARYIVLAILIYSAFIYSVHYAVTH